jgi:diguanylate cyclase
LSTSQGTAVLGLLERATVPPLPVFYNLLFDYLAGAKGLQSARVGAILGDGDGAHERLYAEFVAPYANDEAVERAAAQMSARLEVLAGLVTASAVAAADQSAALQSATEYLSSAKLDLTLVRDWVLRLHDLNERLFRANAELGEELIDTEIELEEIRKGISESRESALLDSLTGVANRDGLDSVIARLRAERPDETMSVALLDIDHFKSLNDSYGHQVGDDVLLLVVRAIKGAVRATDTVGRPGGDEFVVILPDTGLAAAHNIADGIRAAIAQSDLREVLGDDILGGITASLGVAQLAPGESLARLFDRVDRCLYRAKQGGRNRVQSFDGP